MCEASIKIGTKKILSGEHEGWWLAELRGLGVYAPTKEGAKKQLKNILSCSTSLS